MRKLLTFCALLGAVGFFPVAKAESFPLSVNFTYQNGAFQTFVLPGSTHSTFAGINNSGEIAGTMSLPGQGTVGFIYDSGITTTFQFPGSLPGTSTYFAGINDSGQVAGFYLNGFEPGTPYQAFLFQSGAFTPLNLPAFNTAISGINNAGQIVGTYTTNSLYDYQGFVASTATGSFSTIPFLPGGISNSGEIVGFSSTLAGVVGVVDSGGTISSFGIPGAAYIYPTGINASGQIIGGYGLPGETVEHGFLFSNNTFTTIDYQAYQVSGNTVLTGINDNGEIVGYFVQTPEPSTLISLGLGMLALLASVWFKRSSAIVFRR